MSEQAFYRLSARIISRSQGHTVVGLAAYLAAQKLRDERYDEVRNYAKEQYQQRLFASEIIAPRNAPSWVYDRHQLHNRIEAAEKRKDSQLVREVVLSFPVELNHQQKLEVAHRFVREQYVKKGMVADINYHNFEGVGSDNPHAHVLLTMRRLEGENFAPTKEAAWKPSFAKNSTNIHTANSLILQERTAWEKHLNRALAEAGRSERVDCRSLKDRGIDRLPEPKKGKAHRMEQRTQWQGKTRAVDDWYEVQSINLLREEHELTTKELAQSMDILAQLQLDVAIEHGHEVLRQQKKARAEEQEQEAALKNIAKELKDTEQQQRELLKRLSDRERGE